MAKLKLTNAIAEDLKTAASDSFIDSLKMIEIEDIQPNEDNFYEMSEIEELAEDIERQGLMSVLIVETAENGKYQLISGHRRLTAIKRLVDEGRYKSTTVPCYVKSAKSHEETQLDLIMMNATQRKYSDADTMREYEELERIFKALDEAGKPVKGKMRDNIAKVLNVSPAQVAKIDNIKHNAIPDVEQAVKSGEMSISTANEVAKLAPEQQKDISRTSPIFLTKRLRRYRRNLLQNRKKKNLHLRPFQRLMKSPMRLRIPRRKLQAAIFPTMTMLRLFRKATSRFCSRRAKPPPLHDTPHSFLK